MGWASGTAVFDPVVEAILEMEAPLHEKKQVIKTLIDVLENMDWDTQCESEFFEVPLIKSIFLELHPHWYEEED